jgi:sugar diacid utilization regulator
VIARSGIHFPLSILRLPEVNTIEFPGAAIDRALKELFGSKANLDSTTMEAYRRQGYRMSESAEHLEAHYSTVSRRLRRVEKGDL